jgi:hypothetical protein
LKVKRLLYTKQAARLLPSFLGAVFFAALPQPCEPAPLLTAADEPQLVQQAFYGWGK